MYNSKYRGGARAPIVGMGLWSINLGFRLFDFKKIYQKFTDLVFLKQKYFFLYLDSRAFWNYLLPFDVEWRANLSFFPTGIDRVSMYQPLSAPV